MTVHANDIPLCKGSLWHIGFNLPLQGAGW